MGQIGEPHTGHRWCLLSWEAQYTIIEINSDVMENFMPDANEKERIAIVGGGITGLFCAYVLAQRDHKKSVFLFEGSNRL